MTWLLLIFQFYLGSLFTPRADTLKLVFAGDIMQHKEQLSAALIKGRPPGKSSSYDYSEYFTHLKKILSGADLRVANMETTFSGGEFSGYPTFASPESLLEESFKSGFNLFLTANNHICDKGKRGLEYTISAYEKRGIPYTGISRDSATRSEINPYITIIKGFKIAILNYTYGTNGIKVPQPYLVNLLDSTKIEKDVRSAQSANCDIIIAAVHWGSEYVLQHNLHQKRWNNLFRRLGVRYIIGSHPHVPQDYIIERDKDGRGEAVTIFSLGNLISNMSAPYTRLGLIVTLKFTKREGEVILLEPQLDYVWTTRPGEIGKNYSVIPVNSFREGSVSFKSKAHYDNMMKYYTGFTNDR